MIINNTQGELFRELFINLTAGYNREDNGDIAGDIVADKATHRVYTIVNVKHNDYGFIAELK